jgi:hypothetical protein
VQLLNLLTGTALDDQWRQVLDRAGRKAVLATKNWPMIPEFGTIPEAKVRPSLKPVWWIQ